MLYDLNERCCECGSIQTSTAESEYDLRRKIHSNEDELIHFIDNDQCLANNHYDNSNNNSNSENVYNILDRNLYLQRIFVIFIYILYICICNRLSLLLDCAILKYTHTINIIMYIRRFFYFFNFHTLIAQVLK